MPNWCKIEFDVRGTPEALARFKAGVEGVVGERLRAFDFNRMIPMPPELNIDCGSIGDVGYEAFYGDAGNVLGYPWLRSKGIVTTEQLREYLRSENPQYFELGTKYHENLQKFGHQTWYTWCREAWGTKWNACDSSVEETAEGLSYRLETAWSFPEPVFEAMAANFPDVSIEGRMDEEGGYFHGTFTAQDGALTMNYLEGIRKGGPYDYDDEAEDSDEGTDSAG